VERVLSVGLDDARGEVIASENTAKDVDENGFDFRIVIEKLEGFSELFALSTATDIEEVGGLTSVELDDIHGGHSETSTIDEATDVAANVNVVQIEVFGVCFPWVVLSLILLSGKILLTEEGVGVDGDLAVSGKHLAFLGQHKWVDLDHIGVFGHEALIDFSEHVFDLILVTLDTELASGSSEIS